MTTDLQNLCPIAAGDDELAGLFDGPRLNLPPRPSPPAPAVSIPAVTRRPKSRLATDPVFRAEIMARFGIKRDPWADPKPTKRKRPGRKTASPDPATAPGTSLRTEPTTSSEPAISADFENSRPTPAPHAISRDSVGCSTSPFRPFGDATPDYDPALEVGGPKISVPSPVGKRRKGTLTRYAHRMTGSSDLRALLLDRHPGLTGRPDYIRAFTALLSPNRSAEDEAGSPVIVLTGSTLAACMSATVPDAERRYRDADLKGEESTGAFLRAFDADVFGGRLEWEERDRGEGSKRARRVQVSRVLALIHPDVLAAWQDERAAPARCIEGRVYLDDGSAFTKDGRTAERKRIARALKGYEREAHCELAARVAGYMNSRDTLPARTFDGLDFDAARAVAESLSRQSARAGQLDLLARIEEQPVPYYGFSRFSPRVWGVGSAITGLNTAVRRALMPFAVEFDWTSVHFAISAQDWGLPDMHAFLSSGAPLWPVLLSHVSLPTTEDFKRVVKPTGYGINYGAGKRRIIRDGQAEHMALTGAQMDAEQAGRLLTHPLMREALAGRTRELERVRGEITRQGHVLDCFGVPVSEGANGYGKPGALDYSRSVLAQLNQARELWLMEPLLALAEHEAAKDRPAWRIVLWQHDGVSVRFYRDRARHEARITEAMDAHAERHGYSTRFEQKHG